LELAPEPPPGRARRPRLYTGSGGRFRAFPR